MVCIYCGNKTQVSNSRAQKRLNQTWRRRECVSCGAIFTTQESAQLSTSLSVRYDNGPASHFSRDKLFVSILHSLGHRKTAVEDAGAITATIIAKLLDATTSAAISPADIIKNTIATLENFDTAATVQYQAYHKT